nr:hypothetical protein [Tanacetum cinerariifolium]
MFAETHNMVAYLTKFDASKGFNQIIDFLNGCYIKYALTINPNIYVSCIKQFWNTVAIKQINEVTRLQALVDKKKVVITKDAIREVLQLDDAEGVDCLTNEEIFAELACMGYEKPTTKLIFYKAFFSSQWKFLIHTILKSMSAKHTSWNEFSSAMASAVICLSTGKGFLGVETPLFKGMLVGQEIKEGGDAEEHVEDDTVGDKAQGDDTAAHGEVLTDDDVALMDDKEEDKKDEEAKVDTAPSRRRKEVVIKDLEKESTTSSIIPVDTKSKDKGKGIMVEEPKPLKKKEQIKMDEEYARKLHEELNKDID